MPRPAAYSQVTIKCYYRQLGGHIHCRFYSGQNSHYLGKNGELVFDEREWPYVEGCLRRAKVQVIHEHDPN